MISLLHSARRFLLQLLAFVLAPVAMAAGTLDFLKKPDPWFGTEEAKTVAANILSYQSDYGGWPKNMDLTAKPFAGQPVDLVGEFKPIFDNGATTDEVRFMARMYRATKEPRYLRAVENGIDYVLVAQYPTGGWPQVYPPDPVYHRHITFNDNAMVRIMLLLQEVANGEEFAFLDAGRRRAVQSAFQRGVECIVKCQILVNGRLTAWCAQHDEIDLSPKAARRFELVSLSGAESVSIVKLLMSLDRPSPEIVRAIESAVAWFASARIEGWTVVEHPDEKGEGKNWEAIKDPAAPPLWARFYDITTNQPLFSDLDSKARLGIENIGWARHGYRWTGPWAQSLLEKEYPAWQAKLAKTGPGPVAPPWQPRVRIALAGDSTVKDEGGWGFGFKKRLGADVVCENFAGGGQSSKSFRDTGQWQKTLACKPACVLIQFGHNDGLGKGPNRETDPATTYAENLARFIAEAREAGAQPILVTSLARRIFQPDGKLRGELAPYVEAARKVAAEQHVPLIDLYARSVELVEKLGLAGVESFEPKILPKLSAEPAAVAAQDPAAPKPAPADIDIPAPSAKPRRDGTHLTARGSIEFGSFVAEELQRVLPESNVELKQATSVAPKKIKEPAGPPKAASRPAASSSLSPDDFGVKTLTPPVLNVDPDPKYWPRLRMWQGIPSIERTAKGRLWATWYAGPLSEGSNGNHALLVTSGDDGKTWSNPVAVYDPTPFFAGNTGDPNVWIDPQGRLWWFVFRLLKISDPDGIRSLWGFCAENPDDPSPKWNAPVFAGFGLGLNKPTVLSNGDWLRPIDNNQESKQETRTQFFVSRDQGRSFTFFSKFGIKDVTFSEHMAVERKDGSVLMLARTSYGIAQAESFDHGATWVNERPFTSERGVNTRFFLRKLKSGALLLVVNDIPRGRSHMTAMLSEDDGKTWPYKLLLDDRKGVSYPDGTEGANGFLYICYDHGRYEKDEQEILFAKITEADIKAGQVVSEGSQLRQLINRLADFGGGVHKTREPQNMEAEFEKSKIAPAK